MLFMDKHYFVLYHIVVISAITGTVSGFTPCGTTLVKKGCHHDPDLNDRTLKNLLLNHRHKLNQHTWGDGWNDFIHVLTCECAKIAKERGYRFIGLQYFGECWSGDHSEKLFATKTPNKCWGYKPGFLQCNDSVETECIGTQNHNYIYELVPQDINDCANNPCLNGGTCIDGVNLYRCSCDAGYEGDNCEKDVDDCANNSCLNGGTCIDGVNSYRCSCDAGYEGNNCEKDVDDCANNLCLNGGTCIDGVNSYRCSCDAGYEGSNCEKDIDDCANNPCLNGGKCIDEVNSHRCSCGAGYGGNNCEKDIDDCAKKPCLNGGKCMDRVNSYQCFCKAGYEGDNCEKYIDDCAKSPCLNGGKCIDWVNSYRCSCEAGFKGDNCEKNIDDCAKNPCLNGGQCVDGVNSYRCLCKKDYEGRNCEKLLCSNDNWWTTFDKQGWSKCTRNTNFITGFYRSKLSNWNRDEIFRLEMAKCCSSTNPHAGQVSECKSANWWASLDKRGSWSTCAEGYFLNGLYRTSGNNLHNIEEGYCCKPKTHPKKYGHCYHENIRHTFDKEGWSGCQRTGYYIVGIYRDRFKDWLHNIDKLKCCKMSTDIDDCVKNPCVNGGKCIDGTNSYRCSCKIGYEGRNCEKNIDDCAKQPCHNGGKCIDGVNSYRCSCQPGYGGKNCEKLACTNDNWWAKFDKRGWSKCSKDTSFITGFYRSKLSKWNRDEIFLLEEAKCCSATNPYVGQVSECKTANWWASLDRRGSWNTCAEGYFLNGLYRTSGNNLHNIEEGYCCKPKTHPKKYGHCYHENIRYTFDKEGWSKCKRPGYYIVGIYRDRFKDWLHNIDKLKCCKMSTKDV